MPTQAPTGGGPDGRGFDRRRAVTAIAVSLTINVLCPFLLFRRLASDFPPGSIEPLLYVTVFPVAGFILSLARKRSIDAIAILVLLGLATRIGVTIAVGDIKTALVARSLEGAVIGLVFVASVVFDRPIILLFARQVAEAGGRERRAPRNDFLTKVGTQVFFTITTVWGFCLIAMSGVHAILALRLPPAQFLLASPALGVLVNLALGAWSARCLILRMRSERNEARDRTRR